VTEDEEDVGSYWINLRKGEDTSEGGSSRSHYVESLIWKSLWTCREMKLEWILACILLSLRFRATILFHGIPVTHALHATITTN
jgi:hypothetical protein